MAWRVQEADGFRAELNGVRIELTEVPTRAGSYGWLELRSGFETVYIQEPQSVAVFGTRYGSDSERDLAGNMRQLARVVTEQCSGPEPAIRRAPGRARVRASRPPPRCPGTSPFHR